MKKKTELLAPAGEISTVIGAINAGADAVYLGAPSFSARAFAKNLSVEEIIDMIDYAHLFGRKIYLAVNILMKNRELKPAIEMLSALYQAGLDAVIVQDLGLLSILNQCFPELELHASTQMAIMSCGGFEYLKEHNVKRVVPARELSLEEIKSLKKTGMEVECFIHGAMCYSYSGRCYMSSIAGERSGNRGRCAGSCRQPYHTKNCEECYPLSMKDMCSIDHLDELLECGIDSFKIEGRMKAPEYSAGVTSIYRKYMDQYQKKGSIIVEDKDKKILEELYIRSKIQEGYYHKHNGKDMITLTTPSYKKISENQQNTIHDKYLRERKKIEISMSIYVHTEEPVILTASFNGETVSYTGDKACKASKRPLSNSDIEKQMCKTGNTNFYVADCRIDNDNESFVPVSALNEYRRQVIEKISSIGKRNDRPEQEWCELAENVSHPEKEQLRIGISTEQQFNEVLQHENYEGCILPLDLIDVHNVGLLRERNKKVFLRLPDVIREKHRNMITERTRDLWDKLKPDGIYCNCIDALAIARDVTSRMQIIADTGLSIFNGVSEELILNDVKNYTTSYEMNKKELAHFNHMDCREIVIYGNIPVMLSANCIAKTTAECNKNLRNIEVYDEKNHRFIANFHHEYCYNTIYNCVPLSLHHHYEKMKNDKMAAIYRIELTTENEETTKEILNIYCDPVQDPKEWNLKDYTNGHYNRGVD